MKRAVLAALAVALMGCTPLAQSADPIAVRLNDGALEVAVCTPLTLTSVLVQTRATGFMSGRQSPWVAEGRTELAAGDVLSSSQPPAGLTASSWAEPVLAPADELSITLVGEGDESLSATIPVPLSGLPRSEWLNADGSVTARAC